MRYTERGGIGIGYPDEVTFAFLPNIIEITGASGKTASVKIDVHPFLGGGHSEITVPVFGQSLKVDISRLIQSSLFANVMADPSAVATRCRRAIFLIYKDDGNLLYTSTFAVIWGSVEPFGRVGQYGLIKAGEDVYRRAVRYFKHYPFSVECVTGNNQEWVVSIDGAAYGAATSAPDTGILSVGGSTFATAQQRAELFLQAINRDNVWDVTFDATFGNILYYCSQEVSVAIDERAQGYYLRWVDTSGLLQYYLFAEGTDTEKTKDSGTMSMEMQRGGVYYNRAARVYGKERTHTKKICASLVPECEQRMVQSIGAAIVCDLYQGKDGNGQDLWMPVLVNGGSLSVRECRGMQDIEIEIEIPSGAVQRL